MLTPLFNNCIVGHRILLRRFVVDAKGDRKFIVFLGFLILAGIITGILAELELISLGWSTAIFGIALVLIL